MIRTGRAVPMGKRDAVSPGYAAAAGAARAGGYEPLLRLGGGRAAVYHEGTIELAHAVPDGAPRDAIHARFEETAELIARALRALGVDARVGEVRGEYCPGAYSVNARGERKLAGIGQRLIGGAAYLGGVVVAAGANRVREVLVPVYEALDLAWRPETAGAVNEECSAGVGAVRDALLAAYAERWELQEVGLDDETRARARELVFDHRVPVGA